MGISVAAGLLADLKVVENYARVSAVTAYFGAEDMQLYLTQLQFCLFVIDDCFALSYCASARVHGDFHAFASSLPATFPGGAALLFVQNLPLARLLHRLVAVKGYPALERIKSRAGWWGTFWPSCRSRSCSWPFCTTIKTCSTRRSKFCSSCAPFLRQEPQTKTYSNRRTTTSSGSSAWPRSSRSQCLNSPSISVACISRPIRCRRRP